MIAETVAAPPAAETAKTRGRNKTKLITAIKDIRLLTERWRRNGKSIGLVPTMGALHEGHQSLIREARRACDRVVVTLFVNPLQFSPAEDLETYPRDLKKDLRLVSAEKVEVLFAPAKEDMYPEGFSTRVVPSDRLTQPLCGQSRPEHFTGVATVVAKLISQVRPHRAFFGQKDYQQWLVIKRVLADLNLGCEPILLPTVREADGLARSSRNVYLNKEERAVAPALYQALKLAEGMLQVGERNPKEVLEAVRKRLRSEPLITIDYVSVRNADTLEDLNILTGRVLVAVAVRLGKARLIDNILVDLASGS
ncbi:MAG: pantoate--beta-alanine ligase [candidate division FCPU426 bacterium]